MSDFFTHLEGAWDGTRIPKGTLCNTHEGRPIVARYDLAKLKSSLSREEVANRKGGMWKYRELLPWPFQANPLALAKPKARCCLVPAWGKSLDWKDFSSRTSRSYPRAASKAEA